MDEQHCALPAVRGRQRLAQPGHRQSDREFFHHDHRPGNATARDHHQFAARSHDQSGAVHHVQRRGQRHSAHHLPVVSRGQLHRQRDQRQLHPVRRASLGQWGAILRGGRQRGQQHQLHRHQQRGHADGAGGQHRADHREHHSGSRPAHEPHADHRDFQRGGARRDGGAPFGGRCGRHQRFRSEQFDLQLHFFAAALWHGADHLESGPDHHRPGAAAQSVRPHRAGRDLDLHFGGPDSAHRLHSDSAGRNHG